ncbi:MAG: hypothetical protein PVG49_01875 [Desulfobacteraceae bacterium]
MEEKAFCRRCSVVRVNTLCRLYEKGIMNGDRRAEEDLRALAKTALGRGYAQANQVLETGLDPSAVRRMCWNISSVLTDRDLEIRGIDLGCR